MLHQSNLASIINEINWMSSVSFQLINEIKARLIAANLLLNNKISNSINLFLLPDGLLDLVCCIQFHSLIELVWLPLIKLMKLTEFNFIKPIHPSGITAIQPNSEFHYHPIPNLVSFTFLGQRTNGNSQMELNQLINET